MRVAAAIYVAVAVATVLVVRDEPAFSLAGSSVPRVIAELLAGALLLAAAMDAHAREPRRRYTGPIAAAACCWPLTEWNNPGAGILFTIGLAGSCAWAPLLAQGALRGPDELALGRAGRATVAAGWVACVGLLGLAVAAVSEPAESGCVDCPANLLLVHGDASATQDLGRLALMLIAAWAAGLLLVAAVRLARLRPAQRRRAAPVLAPAALAIALLGTQAAHGVDRGFLSNDGTDRLLFTAQIVALALTAAGVAWERERARRARAAVADLVIELGSSAGTTLRDRLAVRLRDPSLRVLYARDDGAGWLDASGAPADAPDGQTTPVVAGDRPLAVLAHRPGLLDDPVLAREVADGSRLALEHERLRALRAAQLAQLQDSRVRIVAAADAERLRLERALHDGAQQSLVALAIGVRLARGQDPVVDAELETVAQEVWTAVAELRAIAHGLFPSALVEEGLDAALEVLSEQQPRLVYRAGSEERFAAPAESAAYFVVTEALQLTEGEVTVGVTSDDGVVRLDVLLMQDPSGPLTALEDRVGAAGGTVHATGRRLSVELPCAS